MHAGFLRFVIHASKPKRPSQQTPATVPDDKNGFCILPYVKGTTKPIKRILSNCWFSVSRNSK